MKKRFLLIAAFLLSLGGVLFAACGNEPSSPESSAPVHKHSYSEEWTTDTTHHWHAATCEHTDEISAKAAHDNTNGVCSVCGYSFPHRVTAGYTSLDDSYHTAPCADCGETVQEKHTLTDGICTACGYCEGSSTVLYEKKDTYAVVTGVKDGSIKDIKVASYYDGVPVTTVARYAFQDGYDTKKQKHIKSIYLPNSITTISNYAFVDSPDLESVRLPETLTAIPTSCFGECKALKSVNVPDTVTKIGTAAFQGCESLTSFRIPNGITTIDLATFKECTGLTSVIIPSSVKKIFWEAFSRCTSLTEVALPEGLEKLGGAESAFVGYTGGVFEGCENLQRINIPTSITEITSRLFQDCGNLEPFDLSRFTSIGAYAFAGCKFTLAELNDAITTLSYGVFSECKQLSVVRAKNVTEVRPFAFDGSGLAALEADSLQIVGEGAFRNCKQLQVISFGNITSIGNVAFLGCTQLPGPISLPSLTSMGDYAFSESNVWNVTLPSKLTSAGEWVFADCAMLSLVTFEGADATEIGPAYFRNCGQLTTINFGGTVTKIGHNAFEGCTRYTTFPFAEGLTEIGAEAFKDCYPSGYGEYYNVALPSTVKTIGRGAFENCHGMSGISIPDGVTSIGSRAFYYCLFLESANIPTGLKKIEAYTFYDCNRLDAIAIEGVEEVGEYAFYHCPGVSGVLPASLQKVGAHAFEHSISYTTSLTVPASLQEIGEYAFGDLITVQTLTFAEGFTAITDRMFAGAFSLQTINFASTITSIGNEAFKDSFKQIGGALVFPAELLSIGDAAFDGCNLTSVIFNKKLQTIGMHAFRGANIAAAMFADSGDGNGGYGPLAIPATVTSIGIGAFENAASPYNNEFTLLLPAALPAVALDAFKGVPLKKIFYCGTQAEWEAALIAQADFAPDLTDVAVYYYSEEETGNNTSWKYSKPDAANPRITIW